MTGIILLVENIPKTQKETELTVDECSYALNKTKSQMKQNAIMGRKNYEEALGKTGESIGESSNRIHLKKKNLTF